VALLQQSVAQGLWPRSPMRKPLVIPISTTGLADTLADID
jgi:hypothetical protein